MNIKLIDSWIYQLSHLSMPSRRKGPSIKDNLKNGEARLVQLRNIGSIVSILQYFLRMPCVGDAYVH